MLFKAALYIFPMLNNILLLNMQKLNLWEYEHCGAFNQFGWVA